MSIADDQFKKLLGMVEEGKKAPRERTEAEEDQMALQLFILEHEGEESLKEYLANPTRRTLKVFELPPHQREIIERARLDQKDFPKPVLGTIYAPRPAQGAQDECQGRCSI
ncbi:MAG: hypothetical protein SA339_05125 [Methanomassiliicoccus sp.]|nr:hypothetical protein [Methanomassiliicoccus sp.]